MGVVAGWAGELWLGCWLRVGAAVVLGALLLRRFDARCRTTAAPSDALALPPGLGLIALSLPPGLGPDPLSRPPVLGPDPLSRPRGWGRMPAHFPGVGLAAGRGSSLVRLVVLVLGARCRMPPPLPNALALPPGLGLIALSLPPGLGPDPLSRPPGLGADPLSGPQGLRGGSSLTSPGLREWGLGSFGFVMGFTWVVLGGLCFV
ncbi:hypothetical protein SAMN02799638_03496 [Arthrobacter sp. UNCCL28]|nr:hypothetical protein SAMN02799638_03496 [Arthrobacter sp. UNCCL28]